MEKRIITKDSKGYGYKYASLADIVAQGYEIPKTKTVTEDGRDFIYFYDPEIKEWLRGAQIVVPEMKNANKAQLYGSAITYALRYSTILYNRLATSEDSIIEDIDDKGESKKVRAKREEQENAIAEVEEGIIDDLRSQMYKEKPKLTEKQTKWLIEAYGLNDASEITDEMVADAKRLAEEKRNANK